MRYAVVIEKAERNYAAYVPDLPVIVHSPSRREGAGEMATRWQGDISPLPTSPGWGRGLNAYIFPVVWLPAKLWKR